MKLAAFVFVVSLIGIISIDIYRAWLCGIRKIREEKKK